MSSRPRESQRRIATRKQWRLTVLALVMVLTLATGITTPLRANPADAAPTPVSESQIAAHAAPAGAAGPMATSGPERSPLRVMVPTAGTWNTLKSRGVKSLTDYFPQMDAVRSFSPGPRMELNLRQRTSSDPTLQAAPASNFRTLAILVQFSDQPASVSASYFDNLLFGATGNTVRAYYQQASYGQLDIVTLNLPSTLQSSSTTGWQTAPQPYSYYVDGKNCTSGTYPRNCRRLTEDLVYMVDPYVNFANYDNNGDGWVDTVFIIHSGTGAEFTGSPNMIWSHSWWTYNEPLVDGVRVGSYTTEPEYWLSPGDMTHGVYAHELGHAFGLPDFYDVDYTSAGVGNWSLMSGGSWNGSLGNSPALPDAWSREFLEFNPVTNITGQNGTFTIDNAAQNRANALYRINSSQPGEYWLLENRQRVGTDAALPGSGLLIWHVDSNLFGSNSYECTQIFNYNCSGGTQHFRVALEQADGDRDLEFNNNQGDSGDPFPGALNNTLFDASSNPNSSSYFTTGDSGIAIRNISASGASMTFRFGPPLVAPGLFIPTNGSKTMDQTPQFSWNSIPGAKDYQLQVDDNPNFLSPEVNVTQTGTSYTPANKLTDQAAHYWRVRARDESAIPGMWSSTWSLIVDTIPAPPTLGAPDNDGATPDRTPAFSWYGVQGAVDYQLQIDNNANFLSPEVNVTQTGTSYTPGSELANATTHYWRVRARNGDQVTGPWSDVWSVLVDTDVDLPIPDVPDLRLPKDRSTVADTTPVFKWKWIEGVTRYDLQVATDPTFTTIVIDTSTDRPRVEVDSLNALPYGNYWWRVASHNAEGYTSAWSLVNQFQLTLLKRPKNASHVEDLTPVFRWHYVGNADQYQFQLASDANFGSLLFNETLATPSFIPLSDLPLGQHWWRVRARVGGVWTVWTPAWTLTLTPPPPVSPQLINPQGGALLDDVTPSFEWDGVPAGHTYQIQIDDNRNFRSPLQDVLLAPGVLTYTADALPDGGLYYWRVRAINALGVAGQWSVRRTVTLAMVEGPVLVSPLRGSAFTDTTPTLIWSGVPNAAQYEVAVALDRTFLAVVRNTSVSGLSYTVPSLPDGRYFWQVRGISATGVPGNWSLAWRFTVDTTGPAAPLLTNPTGGAGTRDTTPLLSWSSVSDTAEYRVQVSGSAGFNTLAVNATATQAQHYVANENALDYGVYYWRVQGTDVLGNTGGWSRTGQFAVTLHKLPDDGSMVSVAQPEFRWAGVADALEYQFQLDDNADFSSVIGQYSGMERTFIPATGLPNGVYYWRVRVRTVSGWSAWMPVWQVTVSATVPSRVQLVSPIKWSLINNNTPTLVWQAATETSYYEIQIDDDRSFGTPDQAVTVVGTRYIAAALPDGDWFWRVRGVNSVGAPGRWSPKWKLTIDTVPPQVPVLVAPLDNARSTNRRLRLEWSSGTDVQRYELWLYPAGGPVPPIDAGATARYRPPTPLTYGTYEWQVRAVDSAGNASAWSEKRTFVVVAGITAPDVPTTPVPTDEVTLPEDAPQMMVVEAESVLLQRIGPWTVAQGLLASGGHYAMSSGALGESLVLRFTGSRLDVVYVQNAALGAFMIELDGVEVMTVDSSALRGTEFTEIVSISASEGAHLLRVVPLRGVVALDAFRVVEQTITPPYRFDGTVTDRPQVETPVPSVTATSAATQEPVTEPAVTPTAPPTVEPTVNPTTEPAITPTIAPTVTPSAEPVGESTFEPAAEPAATLAPDATPREDDQPQLN